MDEFEWIKDIEVTPAFTCPNGDYITIGTKIRDYGNGDNRKYVILDMNIGQDHIELRRTDKFGDPKEIITGNISVVKIQMNKGDFVVYE